MVGRAVSLVAVLCVLGSSCSAGGAASDQDDEADHASGAEQVGEALGDVVAEKLPGSAQTETSVEGNGLTEAEIAAVKAAAGYYNEWDQETFDAYSEASVEARILQQDYVAECMASQGFEFFPAVIKRSVWLPWYSVDRTGLEWVEQYGLGYSSTFLPQRILGEIAVGYFGDDRPEPDISPDSPESRYLNSLSEEEYRQYQIALTGVDSNSLPPDNGEVDQSVRDALDASCQGRANALHPEPMPLSQPDNLRDLVLSVIGSPEWGAYNREGWDCVKRGGFSLNSIDEAHQMIDDHYRETGAEQAIGSTQRTVERIPPEAEAKLAETQRLERQIALIAWECNIHPIQAEQHFDDLTRSLDMN